MHEHGERLKSLIPSAEIEMLFAQTHKCWTFAAPMNLYESIGYGKPTIDSGVALACRFVMEHVVSGSIAYTLEALSTLLGKLDAAPSRVISASSVVAKIARHQLWRARVETAARELVAA